MTNFFDKYGIIRTTINNNNTFVDRDDPESMQEILELIFMAYTNADKFSPRGGPRTIADLDTIQQKEQQLVEVLTNKQLEKEDDEAYSKLWQEWADRERKKRDLSLNREKMKRLHDALKNPEVKDLLLNVMKHKITPQQAFHDIKANPDLKNQIQGLTLNGKLGGKSCVFRRKNKKTTFKSRRNAQRTRRHRKSSTRRSTRK